MVSRIANFFSPLESQVAPDKTSSSSSHTATPAIEGVQLRSQYNASSDQQLSMEEEEEVRHPYIHVSQRQEPLLISIDRLHSACSLVDWEVPPVT